MKPPILDDDDPPNDDIGKGDDGTCCDQRSIELFLLGITFPLFVGFGVGLSGDATLLLLALSKTISIAVGFSTRRFFMNEFNGDMMDV